jgi:DNA (cytosine-5)-methyltransferase 1
MRVLDLCCKAGGATRGFQNLGHHVTGVDLEPQPNYCGDEFILEDALTFLLRLLLADSVPFDFIWASPPCQKHSSLNGLGKQSHRVRTCIIEQLRVYLDRSGKPYAIENVPGAPLRKDVILCGQYFGLGVRRHRVIETNFPVAKIYCKYSHKPRPIAVYGDHPERHTYKPGSGGYINRAHTLKMAQEAMGIDWMIWPEITQAIPPAYSEYIARQFDMTRSPERQKGK